MQMRQRLIRLCVFSVVAYGVAIDSPLIARQPTDEQQLIELEREWCRAELTKDVAALARVLSDDFAGVGGSGIAHTKADALANLNDPMSATDLCIDTNVQVRIYGDAAVLTGLGTRSGTYTGGQRRQMRWTDTFIRREGRWQCVASQGTWLVGPRR